MTRFVRHDGHHDGKLQRSAIPVQMALRALHQQNQNARDEDHCSTPLGWVAKFGKLRMVEFLLSRGAFPNDPEDPPWATPLAWAIRRGHSQIANLLRRS